MVAYSRRVHRGVPTDHQTNLRAFAFAFAEWATPRNLESYFVRNDDYTRVSWLLSHCHSASYTASCMRIPRCAQAVLTIRCRSGGSRVAKAVTVASFGSVGGAAATSRASCGVNGWGLAVSVTRGVANADGFFLAVLMRRSPQRALGPKPRRMQLSPHELLDGHCAPGDGHQ